MSNKFYTIPQIIYDIRNPINNDDVDDGYIPGQPWFNISTKEYFLCAVNTKNNAIWNKINLDNFSNEIRYGNSSFLGNDLPREIEHGLSKRPTFISIFPLEVPDPLFPIGDIWAQLFDKTIKVYNSGKSQVHFCWFVSGEKYEYEELEIRFNPIQDCHIYTLPYVGKITDSTIISFPKDSYIQVCASPSLNHTFLRWAGCDGIYRDPDIGYLTLDKYKIVEPIFKINDKQLNVVVVGNQYGSVISNPNGIGCGSSCTAFFPENTTIELNYILTETNSIFKGWEGCDRIEDDKCIVELNQDKRVVAIFQPDLPKLNIIKTGSGIVRTLLNNNIDCGNDCVAYFNQSEIINLQAIPSPGYNFKTWYGDASSTNNILNVTMDDDKVIGAVFEPITYIVTINKSKNGNVTTDTVNLSCGLLCQSIIDYGESINLIAHPNVNYEFKKWVINNADYFINPHTVVILEDTQIQPIFELKKFSITTDSDDNGSVEQINEMVEFGSTIQINATANIGYEIDTWIGCDQVINGICVINNIQQDKHVSVSFKELGTTYIGSSYGYICGGNNSNKISKFVFPFNSGSSLFINTLNDKNKNSSANHSSTYGYVCGGMDGELIYNKIQRLSFFIDTDPINKTGQLDICKQTLISTNSSTHGFVCSGNLNNKQITNFKFPLDQGKTEISGNLTYVYNGDAFNSSQYGYTTGSLIKTNTLLHNNENNEKLIHSLNTISITTSTLSINYICPKSNNSSQYGYITSGTSYTNGQYIFQTGFNEFDFAFDNSICSLHLNLSKTNTQMASNNSTQYGYICGGYNNILLPQNTMNKINYSLISQNLENENLIMDESKYGHSATDGTIL